MIEAPMPLCEPRRRFAVVQVAETARQRREPSCPPTNFASQPNNKMKFHPEKTDRGWEIADETGTFEPLDQSEVFVTRRECQAAIDEAVFVIHGFDELRAMEGRCE
jgi:hypothetical protein